MADKNEQDDGSGGGRSSVTSSFLKSIGLINPVQDRLKLKALNNIESSAKLALFNARKIQFLFSTLLNQISTTRIEKPRTATDISVGRKITERARSGFKVSNLLKGLLLLIPLMSLLLSDDVKENLKKYFEEFLRALGVTEQALKVIKGVLGSLDDLLKLYLGYKVISKVIKVIRLIITLGKIIKFALKLIMKNCGMGLPVPEAPEPGRPAPGSRPSPGGPGLTPVTPVTPVPTVIPYVPRVQLLPYGGTQGLRLPAPRPPGLPGTSTPGTGLRLPSPAPAVQAPSIPRLGGPTPSATPRPTTAPPAGRTPAQIEDAKIIKEIPTATDPRASKFLTLLNSIGRVIPILNLLIGAYDIYVGTQLIAAGNKSDGSLSILTGIGTIALGVGEILALPVVAAAGGVLAIGGTVAYFIKKLYEYVTTDKPSKEGLSSPSISPPERLGELNSYSTDVNLARSSSRARDTEVVIITKPVVIFNQAFA